MAIQNKDWYTSTDVGVRIDNSNGPVVTTDEVAVEITGTLAHKSFKSLTEVLGEIGNAVTNILYDSTGKKIVAYKGDTPTDVVTAETLKSDLNLVKGDVGLDNVDNTADASKNVNSAVKDGSGNNIANTYETKADALSKFNSITKSSLGLGSVDNTADNAKIVKGANEDGSGNVISSTYETKTDATTKQTALQSTINTIQTTVTNLVGLEGTNYAGFSVDSTEADALAAIPTKYTAAGYTNELVWYLVGDGIDNLKAYRYDGTNTPVLISSKVYDFTDFSGVSTKLTNLTEDVRDIKGGEIGELVSSKKITADGAFVDATTASNRVLVVDVSSLVGKEAIISGVLFAKSGVNDYCWWTIYDNSDNVLIKSETSGTSIQYLSDIVINIPIGAKTLYVQGLESSLPSAKIYSYEELKNAVKLIDNDLQNVKDDILITGQNIVLTPDETLKRYIKTDGSWSTSNLNQVASIVYYVNAGDIYKIQTNSSSGTSYSLLRSIDFSSEPVWMTGCSRTSIPIDTTITIDVPQDGYLVILREAYNTGSGSYLPSSVYKCNNINNSISNIKEEIDDSIYANIKGVILSLTRINSDGTVAAASGANNRILKVDVTNWAGDSLSLTGMLYGVTGGNYFCWWAIHDIEGNVLTKSISSYSTTVTFTNSIVEIPDNAATLYVAGFTSFAPLAKGRVNKVVNSLSDNTEAQPTKTIRSFPLGFTSLGHNTGKVVTNSSYTNDACRHTIDYIKIHKTIKLKNLQDTTTNIRIHFYDENLNWMSAIIYNDSENGFDEIVVEDIPSGAVWFRISIAIGNTSYPNIVKYTRFELDIESEWGYGVETTKEPYVEYQPFLYSVNVSIPIKIANHSYTTKTVFAYDEGLIHLPSTYTHNGKPTPVIFFIHGDAERYSIGESSFSGHMKMQQCWSDAGFAQVDLDLIPSCYNQPTITNSGGTRDDLECLSAAWEWITNHFNVDKRGFYLIGRSRGGQCVCEVLGKGGAAKLPIIAAISMSGANDFMAYSLFSNKVRTEAMWQMWCNSRGLPTENRPSWEQSSIYSTSERWLNDPDIYNFVSDNFDLWSKKELTGWGLITKNEEGITPRDFFDNYIVPLSQTGSTTPAMEQFLLRMEDTIEAKSPVPLRIDWCVGDQTQTKEPFVSTPHSYSSIFTEIILSTPASLAEYRRWPGVDAENPYGETNPHYAENMIFYDGDLTLPNGAVTHNPSKVTMEWLIWCMGKDPRYQGLGYTLPWQ